MGSWYSARVLMRSFVEGRATSLLEDRVILVQASDDAGVKPAILRLMAQEVPYRNPEGELVSWRFIEIIETHYVGLVLMSGVRLYSRRLKMDDLDGIEAYSLKAPDE